MLKENSSLFKKKGFITRIVDAAFLECIIHDLDFINKFQDRKIFLSNSFDSKTISIKPHGITTPDELTDCQSDKKTSCPENNEIDGEGKHTANDHKKNLAICVSHLHGRSKHISIGTAKDAKPLDWTRFGAPIIKAMKEFGDQELFFKELNEAVDTEHFKDKISELFNSPEVVAILSALGIKNQGTGIQASSIPQKQETVLTNLIPLFFHTSSSHRAWREQVHEFEKLVKSITPKIKGRYAGNNEGREGETSQERKSQYKRMSSADERFELNRKINSLIQNVFRGICERSGFPAFDVLPLNNTEYTVPTCPGSSGARVLCINQYPREYTLTWHTHKCFLAEKGVNVGGLGVAQLFRDLSSVQTILESFGIGNSETSELTGNSQSKQSAKDNSLQPEDIDLD